MRSSLTVIHCANITQNVAARLYAVLALGAPFHPDISVISGSSSGSRSGDRKSGKDAENNSGVLHFRMKTNDLDNRVSKDMIFSKIKDKLTCVIVEDLIMN